MKANVYSNVRLKVDVDIEDVLYELKDIISRSFNLSYGVLETNKNGVEELVIYSDDNPHGTDIEIGRCSDETMIQKYKEGREVLDALNKVLDFVKKQGK